MSEQNLDSLPKPPTPTPTPTPMGGRRRRNQSRKTRKSRKPMKNNALREWVNFVKKVRAEEKIDSYKKAMSRAKVRADKGEKWRSMKGGIGEMDEKDEQFGGMEEISKMGGGMEEISKMGGGIEQEEDPEQNGGIILGGRRRRRSRSRSRGRTMRKSRSKSRSKSRY